MNDRPLLFYLWPIVTSIHCPSCRALWENPSVRCGEESYPPFSRNPESEPKCIAAYCPSCGKQLPSLSELHTKGNLGLPPVHNTQFIRDFEDLTSFFDRTSGQIAQLWKYWVSHSNLVMRIFQEDCDEHAFVVCQGTRRVELPQTSFNSTFALSKFGPSYSRCLRLEDKASGATIECGQMGIFCESSELW